MPSFVRGMYSNGLYCLQVLSNSYAFAYFFFGGDLFKGEFTAEQNLTNKNLFEDIQEQLGQEVGGSPQPGMSAASQRRSQCTPVAVIRLHSVA